MKRYNVFRSLSGWSGNVNRYHVTQAKTAEETEQYRSIAEFPVSSRYTADEQRDNAYKYAAILNGESSESTAK